MANPRYSEANPNHSKDKERAATGTKLKSPGGKGKLNFRTANWPDAPSGSGPDRSAGYKKLKIHAQSKGL